MTGEATPVPAPAPEPEHPDILAPSLATGDVEPCLELTDLLAERRLGDAEPLRGATEVKLLGNRHEVPQVPQLECGQIDT